MLRKRVSICIVFLFLVSTCLKAQENSAYTRFGVGNLYNPYPVDLAGYGGLSAASESPTLVNYSNPASYASLSLTTLSTGLYFTDVNLSASYPTSSSQSFQNGSLTNLCIGFPIVKGRWGGSFGLVPYSKQEYSIANLNSTDLGYQSYNSFDDSGSLYKFYMGTGVQIKLDSTNRLSLGVNASYLFGSFSQIDDLAFVDTFNAYNTQHVVTKTLGGVIFQGGLQYLHELKNGARVVFGVQGNLKSSVSGHETDLWDRYIFSSTGDDIKDTILSTFNQKGSMVLPASVGVGIVYTNPGHLIFGVNYDYTNWGNFSSFGDTSGNLTNSWRAAVGAQWIPDIKATHQYFKTVRYSAGLYYEKTDLGFSGTPIYQRAFTLGACFPLSHPVPGESLFARFSTLNITLEAGEKGTLGTAAKPLLLERYLTISMGITLNDLWFVKRKFQ